METIDNTRTTFFQVSEGVWGLKDTFVNIYMVKDDETGNWMLIDTGLKWSAGAIRKTAKDLFGEQPPNAIILTHGHFDHVGSVKKLAKHWSVPVYAHLMELPYLSGQSSYPPPDPTVGGGAMSALSVLYPKSPINIAQHLIQLPADGSIPGMRDWKYIHTPGHSPGHISLYNHANNIVIAGDAFVTTRSESLLATIFQTPHLSGPPKYFTYDWEQARRSLRSIMDLAPKIVATGHGRPMKGEEVLQGMVELYNHFDLVAIPESGRYVDHPAQTDSSGTTWIPPAKNVKKETILQGFAIAAVSVAFIMFYIRKKNSSQELLIDKSFPEQFSPVK